MSINLKQANLDFQFRRNDNFDRTSDRYVYIEVEPYPWYMLESMYYLEIIEENS